MTELTSPWLMSGLHSLSCQGELTLREVLDPTLSVLTLSSREKSLLLDT